MQDFILTFNEIVKILFGGPLQQIGPFNNFGIPKKAKLFYDGVKREFLFTHVKLS